jgi:phospholipase C
MPAIDPSGPPGIPQATLDALREPALAAQGAVLRSKVERIVVLMLENCRFDHLAAEDDEDGGFRAWVATLRARPKGRAEPADQ